LSTHTHKRTESKYRENLFTRTPKYAPKKETMMKPILKGERNSSRLRLTTTIQAPVKRTEKAKLTITHADVSPIRGMSVTPQAASKVTKHRVTHSMRFNNYGSTKPKPLTASSSDFRGSTRFTSIKKPRPPTAKVHMKTIEV
jgi:hypothetical protein